MAKSARGLVDFLEKKKPTLPAMLTGTDLIGLGIFPSKSYLFILRKKKKGPPCIRMGGFYYYNVDDLIAWVDTKYQEAGL